MDSDDKIFLDLSNLSGDPSPCTLAAFLEENAEAPPSAEEVQALRTLPLGGTTYIGIGGGAVLIRRLTPYDIMSDGKTVWINGAYGLLGRFGLYGIDVHRPLTDQSEKGECLHCTHEPTTRADWDVFVAKMLEHCGVHVPDEYMPERFTEKVGIDPNLGS
jgi:hypothetical protein